MNTENEIILRTYYRCQHCLSTMTSDHEIETCPCGGTLYGIGEVRKGRVWDIATMPACDGRCTGAQGPLCDCQCLGENHGSGKDITRLINKCSAKERSQFERGALYLKNLAEMEATFETLPYYREFSVGRFIPDKYAWLCLRTLREAINAFRTAETWGKREKIFTNFKEQKGE